MPSTIHLRAAVEKQNGFCRYIVTNKVDFWAASYSACVVYTKTIIHLSVGESGGYFPPVRLIIVNCLRQNNLFSHPLQPAFLTINNESCSLPILN